MGRRKQLHITSTDNSKMQDYPSNSHDAQGNVYMEARPARIQENKKRLRELGVKNVVDSMTSLVDSNKMKKKTVKRNTRAGDVDYIPNPDPGDDSEEDNQQVGRSIVESKKRHHSQYIPPMSMSRAANLTKLGRVLAPNVSQKVPSTSNATKPNKEGAKRRMILVDEDDDEDVEIFQGNKVDKEVDGVDEDDEHGDMADHNFSEDENNDQEQLHGPEKDKATGNVYMEARLARIQENQKRLRELGVKNVVDSMTSLVDSNKMKKKPVKRNTRAGDVDYIPDPGEDSGDDCEEDNQQVGRSIVVPKKRHHSQYIPPMSMSRTANLTKLRRVLAPNVSQKVLSTSNATKPNKEVAKRRMIDDEDEEIFQGNKVDMEVDGADEDDEHGIMADPNYSEDENNNQEQLHGPGKDKATGAPKKVRGHTQKAEIWKMNTTERIDVTFNDHGQPVGEEGKELVQYLGTLVRMADHVSIEYSDWRKVPMKNKEDMYSLVKSKFAIHPVETSEIKEWIFQNMGKKWRTWKGVLKSRGYDPSLTIDEIVTQQTNNDNRVNPTQFKELVTRWFTPKFQTTCAAKRLSRSKMKEPHVTGTKSFARLAHEVATKNDGVYPTRGEMYITTRTRKDGSFVDDKAANVVASLKAIASDSASKHIDPHDFTNDEYSKVKGPEKRGYVRLVGRMPATKSKGDSSTNSHTIHQLQSVVNVMMNIIQERIPDANLPTVLSNMNIQVPRVGSSAPSNSLPSNELSSSRSDDIDDRAENM
ncbi:putative transposase, Ptta/En/Spm, plant [Helianthus annuus]|nr:putative transposase, Ptta/En/Spm, plant [Helianthus annuus]